jgi:hypothetical protein
MSQPVDFELKRYALMFHRGHAVMRQALAVRARFLAGEQRVCFHGGPFFICPLQGINLRYDESLRTRIREGVRSPALCRHDRR